MPWTIRELADKAGVTKQTIVNRLDREGLRSWHVTEQLDGSLLVDDEAAKQVLAKYPVKLTLRATNKDGEEEQDEMLGDGGVAAELRKQISDLKHTCSRLEAENDELKRRNSELERKVSEYSDKIVRQADEIKALPAPDAIDRAREDGRRDGVDEGKDEGRKLERADMAKLGILGFWDFKRRYLKGARKDYLKEALGDD